ncbi:MAG: hypothetical protein MJY74_06580 [Bacteroidaceae bacterium]|nr:hypothetical protein [Bacteroidaceae bacterium]
MISLHYSQDEKELANDMYARTEGKIQNNEAAVVLVAVSSVKELREAYPSYFLNAGEFLSALADFQKRCKVNEYI